jgi:hypothetical protein
MSTAKKPTQREEKVKLHHGPWVSKSTARKIQEKNKGFDFASTGLFLFVVFVIVASLIKGCVGG